MGDMKTRPVLRPLVLAVLCIAILAATAPRKLLLTLNPGEGASWSDVLSDADDGTLGILPSCAFEPPRTGRATAAPPPTAPVCQRPLARHDAARSPPLTA